MSDARFASLLGWLVLVALVASFVSFLAIEWYTSTHCMVAPLAPSYLICRSLGGNS